MGYDAELPRLHNPVLHELSLASWLVSTCQQYDDEYWSSPSARREILQCCAEIVQQVGELADLLTSHDAEVATAVRHLTALLARQSTETG